MEKMLLFEQFIQEKEDKFADYPKAASKNAKKAIEWKEKYGRDEVQGGTEVGWQRAHQLAKGEAVSRDVLGRMAAFNRHRKNSKVSAEYKDTPWKDNGHIAWLIWGGDEGVDWAIKKMDQLEESAIYEGLDRHAVSLTKMLNTLKEVNKLYPDATFMVPSDYLGHASTERTFKEAVDILKKHDKNHKDEKDPVEFYIWNLSIDNEPLRFNQMEIIKKGAKGFKDFSKKHSRQFDNTPYIKRVHISMESKGIEQFGRDMTDGKYGSLD